MYNYKIFTISKHLSKGSEAFTLVELLIASTLTLLVIVASMSIYLGTTGLERRTEQRVVSQKESRYLQSVLKEDLKGCDYILTPQAGQSGNVLELMGLKVSRILELDSEGFYEPKENINAPWFSRHVVVYEKDSADPNKFNVIPSANYDVDYQQGRITFNTQPANEVKADFTYDLMVSYELMPDGETLNRQLWVDSNGYGGYRNLLVRETTATDIIRNSTAENIFSVPQKNQIIVNAFFGSALESRNQTSFTMDIQSGLSLDIVRPTDDTEPDLNAVYAVDSQNAWAVGDQGKIMRFQNGSWQQVASPTSSNLNSIWFADESVGWIGGDNGTILNFNGSDWSNSPITTNENIVGVWSSDINNSWATTPWNIYKYENNQWQFVKNWAEGQEITGIAGKGQNIVTVSNWWIFYSNDGGQNWVKTTCDDENGDAYGMTAIACVNNDAGNYRYWSVGDFGFVFRSDGLINPTFQKAPTSVKNWPKLNGISFFDYNDAVAVGDRGAVTVYDQEIDTWTQVPYPGNMVWNAERPVLKGVFLYRPSSGWIVGEKGLILRIGRN